MTAVACLAEERQLEEWGACKVPRRGRPTVDGLPLSFKKAAKAAQRLPHVHRDVLAFPSAVLPQCRNRHALRCQADRRHRAKAKRTGNDGILPVERELAATIRDRQADVPEHIVHSLAQVEFRRRLGIGQLRLECLSQTLAPAIAGRFVSHIIHCDLRRMFPFGFCRRSLRSGDH
jgi:hypothetical protein